MVQPKAWFNDDVLLEYGELPHVLQIVKLRVRVRVRVEVKVKSKK